MRILLCNVGYFLGHREFLGGYLPHPRDALIGNGGSEDVATNALVELVAERVPDVIGLIELDRGSFRTTTDGQLNKVQTRLAARGARYTGRIFNKYGSDSLWGQLPFFRHLGNAVLLRKPYPVRPMYLDAGMKRLVIETRLPNEIVLLLTHLSVRKSSRRRQLRELAALINEYPDNTRVIVAGDLNTYRGLGELEYFTQTTGLLPYVPGESVPERPGDELLLESRAIDLFLCSPELDVKQTAVAGEAISDHRPVFLELNSD